MNDLPTPVGPAIHLPQTSDRLTAEGQGRPGFVKGSSAIALRADGAATMVDVSGTVQTGGPIARVGQRLIGSVSKMMVDPVPCLFAGKAVDHDHMPRRG